MEKNISVIRTCTTIREFVRFLRRFSCAANYANDANGTSTALLWWFASLASFAADWLLLYRISYSTVADVRNQTHAAMATRIAAAMDPAGAAGYACCKPSRIVERIASVAVLISSSSRRWRNTSV